MRRAATHHFNGQSLGGRHRSIQKWVFFVSSALLMSTFLLSVPFSAASASTNATIVCPVGEDNCGGSTGLPEVSLAGANGNNTVHTIFSLVFGIIGAVAVLFMVISGIRLVLSAGDPNALENARNTLLYSSIGLVIAVSAELIVNFVVTRL
jgi:hypothetical protein